MVEVSNEFVHYLVERLLKDGYITSGEVFNAIEDWNDRYITQED
jgi:hypothetical protein